MTVIWSWSKQKEDGGRLVGHWNDIYLFGEVFLGGSNTKNWGDYWKKNLFTNSVELSMCDGPIETVKYIWVNILYMFHWIFSKSYRNSLPLHKAGSTRKECKIVDAVVLDELLAVNANTVSYQIEEYKNSSFIVILHSLNSFQHYNYVAFLLFICTF